MAARKPLFQTSVHEQPGTVSVSNPRQTAGLSKSDKRLFELFITILSKEGPLDLSGQKIKEYTSRFSKEQQSRIRKFGGLGRFLCCDPRFSISQNVISIAGPFNQNSVTPLKQSIGTPSKQRTVTPLMQNIVTPLMQGIAPLKQDVTPTGNPWKIDPPCKYKTSLSIDHTNINLQPGDKDFAPLLRNLISSKNRARNNRHMSHSEKGNNKQIRLFGKDAHDSLQSERSEEPALADTSSNSSHVMSCQSTRFLGKGGRLQPMTQDINESVPVKLPQSSNQTQVLDTKEEIVEQPSDKLYFPSAYDRTELDNASPQFVSEFTPSRDQFVNSPLKDTIPKWSTHETNVPQAVADNVSSSQGPFIRRSPTRGLLVNSVNSGLSTNSSSLLPSSSSKITGHRTNLSHTTGIPVNMSPERGLPVNMSPARGLPVNMSHARGHPMYWSPSTGLPVSMSHTAGYNMSWSPLTGLSVSSLPIGFAGNWLPITGHSMNWPIGSLKCSSPIGSLKSSSPIGSLKSSSPTGSLKSSSPTGLIVNSTELPMKYLPTTGFTESWPPTTELSECESLTDLNQTWPPSKDLNQTWPPSKDLTQSWPPSNDLTQSSPPSKDLTQSSPLSKDLAQCWPPATELTESYPPTGFIEYGSPSTDLTQSYPLSTSLTESWLPTTRLAESSSPTGLAESSSPTGLSESSSPTGLSESSSPTGLAESSPLKGLAESSPLKGLAESSPLKGLTQSSPLKGLTQSSPPKGLTQRSPPKGLTQRSPPKGLTQSSPPKGLTQSSPPKGLTQSSPPKGLTQSSPPKGLTQSSPPKGLTQSSPPKGLTQSSPPKGLTQSSPPKGLTKISPPKGLTKISPPKGLTQSFSPTGIAENTTGLLEPSLRTILSEDWSSRAPLETSSTELPVSPSGLVVNKPLTSLADVNPLPPPGLAALNAAPASRLAVKLSSISGHDTRSSPSSELAVNSSPSPGLSKNFPSMSELPRNLSPTSELPRNVSPTSELPRNVSPTSELPRNVSPTSELPRNVSLTLEHPRNLSPTSELPRNVSPTSEHPRNVPPTSEHPRNLSPTSEHPRNVSPTSELPRNVSLLSGQPLHSSPVNVRTHQHTHLPQTCEHFLRDNILNAKNFTSPDCNNTHAKHTQQSLFHPSQPADNNLDHSPSNDPWSTGKLQTINALCSLPNVISEINVILADFKDRICALNIPTSSQNPGSAEYLQDRARTQVLPLNTALGLNNLSARNPNHACSFRSAPGHTCQKYLLVHGKLDQRAKHVKDAAKHLKDATHLKDVATPLNDVAKPLKDAEIQTDRIGALPNESDFTAAETQTDINEIVDSGKTLKAVKPRNTDTKGSAHFTRELKVLDNQTDASEADNKKKLALQCILKNIQDINMSEYKDLLTEHFATKDVVSNLQEQLRTAHDELDRVKSENADLQKQLVNLSDLLDSSEKAEKERNAEIESNDQGRQSDSAHTYQILS